MQTWERWPLTAGLLALWGAVFLAGLPYPNGSGSAIDDLWYTDAAITLAATGHLQAPALERHLAPWHTLDLFLVPPFHDTLLGGWLALFGISTASLLGAYAFCHFLSSLFLWRLLRGFGLGIVPCLLSLAAFVPYALNWCLRPEPVGIPFLLGGLLLLRAGGPGRLFAGFLALGLAVGCAVNLLPPAAALAGAVLALHLRSGSRAETPPLRVVAAMATLAVAAFLLIFAILIRFRFHDFLAQFLTQVATRRGGPFYRGPLDFVLYLAQYWRALLYGPAYAGLALAGLLCRRRPEPVRWLIWGACAAAALNLLYRPNNLDVNLLFAWVAVFAFLGTAPWPAALRAGATGAAAACLLLSQSLWIASVAGQARVDRAACARLRAELEHAPGRFVVDDYAARYVFDFRLPPGTLDVGYLRPLPLVNPTAADKRPGETWVCSIHSLDMYVPEFLETRPERLRLFGHTFSLLKDPGRIQVVP